VTTRVGNEWRVFYNDPAFDHIDKLKAAHFKESVHFARGDAMFRQVDVPKALVSAPEEVFGFKTLYKHQGLFPKHGMNIKSLMELYQFQTVNPPAAFEPFTEKWWHFVYRIPRRF